MSRRRASSGVAPVRVLPLVGGFARDVVRSAGRRGGVGIAAMALAAMLEAVGLILIMPLLSIALGRASLQPSLDALLDAVFQQIGVNRRPGQLMVMLWLFGALFVARTLVIALRDITLSRATIAFVDARRKSVVRSAAHARWDVISRMRQAKVAQVLGADMQNVATAARLLQFVVIAAATLAAQCVAAVALSPRLSLFSLAIVAVGAVTLMKTLRQAHMLGHTILAGNLSAMDTVVQFFGGLKLAVSQNLQSSYVAEVENTLDGIAEHQLRFVRSQARRQVIIGSAAVIAGMIVAATGLLVFHLAPAVLVGLLLVLVRMTGPASVLRQQGQQLVQILPAYRAMLELEAELADAAAPAASTGAAPASRDFRGGVELRQVSFAHAGQGADNPVLADCSAAIAPGEFVGLVGLSGAGKTTLVDLLVGLHRPMAGGVLVDGQPLIGGTVAAWRQRVSYISQDPYLFHDSIRHNLLWANPAASEEDVWWALRLAGAEDFVRAMPAGLDAVVGERGTLVSGGERQRLAIARAMIRRPCMLILDEATNAIDVAAERTVIANLLAVDPRPSILMIAHRSESLERCDRLLWLDGGRIAGLDAAARAGIG